MAAGHVSIYFHRDGLSSSAAAAINLSPKFILVVSSRPHAQVVWYSDYVLPGPQTRFLLAGRKRHQIGNDLQLLCDLTVRATYIWVDACEPLLRLLLLFYFTCEVLSTALLACYHTTFTVAEKNYLDVVSRMTYHLFYFFWGVAINL